MENKQTTEPEIPVVKNHLNRAKRAIDFARREMLSQPPAVHDMLSALRALTEAVEHLHDQVTDVEREQGNQRPAQQQLLLELTQVQTTVKQHQVMIEGLHHEHQKLR